MYFDKNNWKHWLFIFIALAIVGGIAAIVVFVFMKKDKTDSKLNQNDVDTGVKGIKTNGDIVTVVEDVVVPKDDAQHDEKSDVSTVDVSTVDVKTNTLNEPVSSNEVGVNQDVKSVESELKHDTHQIEQDTKHTDVVKTVTFSPNTKNNEKLGQFTFENTDLQDNRTFFNDGKYMTSISARFTDNRNRNVLKRFTNMGNFHLKQCARLFYNSDKIDKSYVVQEGNLLNIYLSSLHTFNGIIYHYQFNLMNDKLVYRSEMNMGYLTNADESSHKAIGTFVDNHHIMSNDPSFWVHLTNDDNYSLLKVPDTVKSHVDSFTLIQDIYKDRTLYVGTNSNLYYVNKQSGLFISKVDFKEDGYNVDAVYTNSKTHFDANVSLLVLHDKKQDILKLYHASTSSLRYVMDIDYDKVGDKIESVHFYQDSGVMDREFVINSGTSLHHVDVQNNIFSIKPLFTEKSNMVKESLVLFKHNLICIDDGVIKKYRMVKNKKTGNYKCNLTDQLYIESWSPGVVLPTLHMFRQPITKNKYKLFVMGHNNGGEQVPKKFIKMAGQKIQTGGDMGSNFVQWFDVTL